MPWTIAKGTMVTLIFTVGTMILMLLSMRLAKTHKFPIRKISGVEAIEELVLRCVEMAKPLHLSPGATRSVYDVDAPQQVAGLSIISYAAQLCAKNGCAPIVSVGEPSILPMVDSIVREAYMAAGKPSEFRSDMIREHGSTGAAFTAAVSGIFFREKPGGNIMVGPLYSEALEILEPGARAGMVQIAGTAKTPQMPFLAAVADYIIIGEELFAAGAFLSNDPKQLGTIFAEDVLKGVFLGLIIVGTILAIASSDVLVNLMRL